MSFIISLPDCLNKVFYLIVHENEIPEVGQIHGRF